MEADNSLTVPRGPECSICQEVFKDPKVLPCGHSFCLHCLLALAPPGTRNIKCPLCQREIDLPDGDVRNLPTNFDLRDAVEGIDGRYGGDAFKEQPHGDGDGNEEKKPEGRGLLRNLAIGGAVAVGGVAAAAAVPFVILPAIGFASGGIVGGSVAAGMMSSAAISSGGGVAAGSAVAICQSIGAAGLAGSTYAAAGAAAGGVGFAAAHLSDKSKGDGAGDGAGDERAQNGDDGRNDGDGHGELHDDDDDGVAAVKGDGHIDGGIVINIDEQDGIEVGLPSNPPENRNGRDNSEAESKATILNNQKRP